MNPEDQHQEHRKHIEELAAGRPVLRGGVHPGAPGEPHRIHIEVELEGGTTEVRERALPEERAGS